MAITKALMYARVSSSTSIGTGLYKKARIGATRLGFFGPKQILKINGTLRTNNFDRDTWEVTERGRGQGKTLTIDVFGFTPVAGQEVILGIGAITNRLFRGTVVRVRQVRARLNEGRIVYRCQCVDGTYQLGNIRVTKKYLSQTGTAIAQSLIASFAPAGFTATHVQGGLATLDDIQFTMQTLPSALQQLCERIGGAFYIDADKDLHLYVGSDPSGVNPEALTDSNKHLRSGFTYESDIEALRNRILVECMGSVVTSDVPAASTSIPVQDTAPFATTGTNHGKLEAQRITYTGVSSLAGQGCVTAGLAGAGPSAPGALQSSGGVPASYVGGNLLPGVYQYKVTFVDGSGETPASAEASVTVAEVSAPSTNGFDNGGGLPMFGGSTTGGSLTTGVAYAYKVTYVTAAGETDPSHDGYVGANYGVIVSMAGADTAIALSRIPVSSDGRVTKRRIYRSQPNGGGGTYDTFKLVTTINDNTTTTYTDTTADGSLGVDPPATNTAGSGKVDLSSIAVGPTGTTSRKIYRTVVNGSTFKLLATIADNTTTTRLDNTTDGSLGATLTGSSIGTGPGATSLAVTDLSKFPSGGWVRVASQVIYFTGRSGSSGEGTLTGVPASGPGAITATIPASSMVVVEPHLTGVPASGTGAIEHTLSQSESVNPIVIAEDLTSQGTYGSREDYVQDRRLSLDGAADLAAARLALQKDPRISGSLSSTDPKLGAGRPLSINSVTWGLTASVTVQQISIKPDPTRAQPLISAQVATRTLEDLYAQLRDIREQLARR
jgi:hypothetical protein